MTSRSRVQLLVSTCAVAAAICGSPVVAATADSASFAADGKTFAFIAPGFAELRSGASVAFQAGEKPQVLRSGQVGLSGPVRQSVADTPFGPADVFTATYGAPDQPYSFTLTLKKLRHFDAVTLQGVFHNRSGEGVKLRAFDLLDTTPGAGGKLAVSNPAEWLVTPLMEATPAVPLPDSKKGYNEAAMLYRSDGTGFLVGPVGPAEAHVIVDISGGAVKAYAQMDNVLVPAGQSRRSEEIIVCFEPPRTATDLWTRWVAVTHGARTIAGPIYGWCSWYDRTTKIDEAHVRDVLGVLAANPDVFGRGVLQIDDGYQKMDGDWSGNAKFPSGMAALAKDIRAKGWIPGVWFAPLMINPDHPWSKKNPEAIQKNAQGIASFMNANPFHPDGANWINPDHPESKKFLFNIINDARQRGYGYIKIDFNGIGSQFVDPTKTRLQIFRELYARYREAAGQDMYILSCLGQPTRGVIGFIDAARVGPDSHPAHFEKCLDSVLRFQIFDNVWWQNDPDVSYLAAELPSRVVGKTAQGEGMWRTWHNIVCLVGGTAMVSEPLPAEDAKAVWRNFEIMRPSSREPASLLTLGRSPRNEIFGFAARRPYGDFAVYNLYNPQEGQRPLFLDFAPAGLPSGAECAVFDFWENKVVARAKDRYETAPLPHLSSALLRFTPLAGDQPILVGSNLHLSMGATEIDEIRVTPGNVEVMLSDAGAQQGSLTFHSTRNLEAGSAENCAVTGVESLGDNLWRVDLKDRRWGQPQKLVLKLGS